MTGAHGAALPVSIGRNESGFSVYRADLTWSLASVEGGVPSTRLKWDQSSLRPERWVDSTPYVSYLQSLEGFAKDSEVARSTAGKHRGHLMASATLVGARCGILGSLAAAAARVA